MISSYPCGIYNLVDTADFNQIIHLTHKHIVLSLCHLHCSKHFVYVNLFNAPNNHHYTCFISEETECKENSPKLTQ